MTKSQIDKLHAEVTTATQEVINKNFIKASVAELDMYVQCRRVGCDMPEAGSAAFWELFDQIESSKMEPCSRELMGEYVRRPEPEHKDIISNDPAVRELEHLLAERRTKERCQDTQFDL